MSLAHQWDELANTPPRGENRRRVVAYPVDRHRVFRAMAWVHDVLKSFASVRSGATIESGDAYSLATRRHRGLSAIRNASLSMMRGRVCPDVSRDAYGAAGSDA
jgi:hypothetical protein